MNNELLRIYSHEAEHCLRVKLCRVNSDVYGRSGDPFRLVGFSLAPHFMKALVDPSS